MFSTGNGNPPVVTPAIDVSRLVLPNRIRTKPVRAPESFELAARVAGLPNVRMLGHGGNGGSLTACIYLEHEPTRRTHAAPILLGRFGPAGISVEGLNDAERYQVLSTGWGRLEQHRVRLFPPRDEADAEVCWAILRHAYTTIINAPERSHVAPRVLFDDLPKPSRPSLA
jgi:hypothetical protein